jgi:DNA repair protein RadC
MRKGSQGQLELGASARRSVKEYPVPVSRVRLVADGPALLAMPAAGSDGLAQLLAQFYEGEAVEVFAVVLLDARRRPIQVVKVAEGTLTQSLCHPREVFRAALFVGNVAAVVVAHNHPSGDPTPSPDDCHCTRKLREAAQVLAIPLLDHLVIGAEGRYYSFAAHGWA